MAAVSGERLGKAQPGEVLGEWREKLKVESIAMSFEVSYCMVKSLYSTVLCKGEKYLKLHLLFLKKHNNFFLWLLQRAANGRVSHKQVLVCVANTS